MKDQFRDRIVKINQLLHGWNFDLTREKDVQEQVMRILKDHFNIKRKHRLSEKSIVDFWIDEEIAVEMKVKGSKTAIFRQCQRYCEFEDVKCLLLLTARSMGFPPEIHGKPCYYISLSRGML